MFLLLAFAKQVSLVAELGELFHPMWCYVSQFYLERSRNFQVLHAILQGQFFFMGGELSLLFLLWQRKIGWNCNCQALISACLLLEVDHPNI